LPLRIGPAAYSVPTLPVSDRLIHTGERGLNFSHLAEIAGSIKYFPIREVKIEGCTMTGEIKVAPMHKLIKRAGAARVSEESAIALGKALEEVGLKVAKEAIDFARHAGRKTVKARDIEIAAQKVLSR